MTMHADQIELPTAVAARLVRRALAAQGRRVPGEIVLLPGAGTTSHVLRVGEELLARFPMTGSDPVGVREQIEAEHAAMEEFAALCPFPSPRPVLIGEGDAGHPLPFSVQTWVPGEVATPTSVAGSSSIAEDLAELIGALRGAPRRGRRFSGSGRGGELTAHDAWIHECLERSTGLLPVAELRAMWDHLRTLPREQPDVMSHTDLIPANLLTAGDRIAGVLDCGGLGAADPALDLVAAWHLLEAPAREVLHAHLGSGELERRRGAAWAFAQAIGLVWYYERSNPAMAELGRSTLSRLLAAADELTDRP